MAEHETHKEKYLYVLGTDHAVKFLNGGRAISLRLTHESHNSMDKDLTSAERVNHPPVLCANKEKELARLIHSNHYAGLIASRAVRSRASRVVPASSATPLLLKSLSLRFRENSRCVGQLPRVSKQRSPERDRHQNVHSRNRQPPSSLALPADYSTFFLVMPESE